MKKHLIDYPPRSTACGLYYPKGLTKEGFGTYHVDRVTCGNCLKVLKALKRRVGDE